jgi:hypothetical protein
LLDVIFTSGRRGCFKFKRWIIYIPALAAAVRILPLVCAAFKEFYSTRQHNLARR